jgi:hypothetical protein
VTLTPARPGFAIKKMIMKENPQSNCSAETAVKKLFLFSMHSLNLELEMMLFLLAEV